MPRFRAADLWYIPICLLLAIAPCGGQTYVREFSSILFFNDSGPYTEPLSGGINAPMQQLIDSDGDGDLDLYIFDNDFYPVRYFFRNEGDSTVPLFVLDPTDSFYGLPFTFWFLFTDFDSDGSIDLLTDDGSTGVLIWHDSGTAVEPDWSSSLVPVTDTAGNPLFAGFASLPGITDLDGDGLKDFLSSNSADGSFNYYRNTGSVGDARYALVSNNFENITILGDTCVSAPPRPEPEMEARHGAGAIALADLDSNGTVDLFYGDIFSHSLFQIMNIGTPGVPDLECVSNFYPPDTSLNTVGFNQASFADIDGDGDLDLFVGVMNSRTRNSLWFYRNRGTSSSALFQLETTDFIPTLDVGQNAHPALADLDGDNDQDLVIGNTTGSLWHFRNDGTPQSPLFNLADTLFGDISGNYSYAPVFADMDADSAVDLVLGRFDGKVLVYRNGGGGVFTPVDSVASGQYAVPAVGDIDGDADPDLLVGKSDGTLTFFRNEGDPAVFSPVLVTDLFAGIDVGENARPVLVMNDSTGLLDLFVTPAAGNSSQGGQSSIYYYYNGGTTQSPQFSLADADWGPDVPFEPALAFTDLDDDGDRDILVGTSKGGLHYFRNDPLTGVTDAASEPAGFSLEQNYPNPFNGVTIIRFNVQRPGDIRIEIFNVAGERVAVLVDRPVSPGSHDLSWSASGRPSGVYYCRLSAGPETARISMIYIK